MVTIVLLILLVFSSGCAQLEDLVGGPGNVAGRWTFKDESMGKIILTFKRDGTYDLDRDRDGIKDIWGEYRTSDNWIILRDTGGCHAPDCGREGAYVYDVSLGAANFALIADQCPYRARALAVPWKRRHL